MKQLLLFICLLFSITVFSQQNKFDLGIIGGPSITYLRSSAKNSKISPNIGFYAGVSAQYNFNKYCALHTEMAFERKGDATKVTLTDINGNVIGTPKFTFQYNCLTLPVLFRASFGEKVKFFLNAGPYVSYLLKAEYKNILGYNSSDGNNFNETSYLHKIDVGITQGLGIIIPVQNKLYLSCELRDNLGIVGLFKSTNYSNGQSYNHSLALLFGLNYKFGK